MPRKGLEGCKKGSELCMSKHAHHSTCTLTSLFYHLVKWRIIAIRNRGRWLYAWHRA